MTATRATPPRTSGSWPSTPTASTRMPSRAAAWTRPILAAANQAWQECLALGEKNGYRNAQASLLAPTGTIGLMMDCDTTGVEPDLALVKFKKLVGGGSMQIVNQTVPRALKNLGYQPEQAEAIIEYIAEHGHVVDAPGLRPEHYEVFDCAMGERAISPMGHVRMMAAVQPALSGVDQQDGQPAGERHDRGHREGLLRGLEARPQGAGDLPGQLQGRPAAVGRQEEASRGAARGSAPPAGRSGRAARRPAGAAAAAQAALGHRDPVLRRRRRGLHDRVDLPGRRRRRGVPQARQAGLDAGRRHGRLLGGDLGRPAVRHAAGVLRREVHQHAVRAGRDHRRPGHPDGQLGDGLHLPPAGPRPPALRRSGPTWASCRPPSARRCWTARTRRRSATKSTRRSWPSPCRGKSRARAAARAEADGRGRGTGRRVAGARRAARPS